jgi:hypothetical protein
VEGRELSKHSGPAGPPTQFIPTRTLRQDGFLNMLEKLSATSTGGTKSDMERKRKRSESSSSSHSTEQQRQSSNTSACYPQQARGRSQPQGRVYRVQSRDRGSNTCWDSHSIHSANSFNTGYSGNSRCMGNFTSGRSSRGQADLRQRGQSRGRYWPRW